jgi:pyrroline-5-carboxylate reductase
LSSIKKIKLFFVKIGNIFLLVIFVIKLQKYSTELNKYRKMKILIIGGGNMGQSFAKSFVNNYITDASNFAVLEKDVTKFESLKKIGINNIYSEPNDKLGLVDLIVLAVKPQVFRSLAKEIAGFINNEQVVLSIMAGIDILSIQQFLHVEKVIRAMPNIASQIGKGMSVFTSSDSVTRIELVTVQNLLESTGKNIYVANEELIDAGTAISGSGPAYVLYFMQAISNAALELGFSKRDAEMLTIQTFKGIVEYLQNSTDSYQELINKISSKGGTTEAAINLLNHKKVNKLIKDAVFSAYHRAKELGKAK